MHHNVIVEDFFKIKRGNVIILTDLGTEIDLSVDIITRYVKVGDTMEYKGVKYEILEIEHLRGAPLRRVINLGNVGFLVKEI